jgi:hypothetical protein
MVPLLVSMVAFLATILPVEMFSFVKCSEYPDPSETTAQCQAGTADRSASSVARHAGTSSAGWLQLVPVQA